MKYIVDMYTSDIEEIHAINRYMRDHINSCHKASKKRTAYPQQSTAHFEDFANIAVDSDSVISQENKIVVRNIAKKMLITKKR